MGRQSKSGSARPGRGADRVPTVLPAGQLQRQGPRHPLQVAGGQEVRAMRMLAATDMVLVARRNALALRPFTWASWPRVRIQRWWHDTHIGVRASAPTWPAGGGLRPGSSPRQRVGLSALLQVLHAARQAWAVHSSRPKHCDGRGARPPAEGQTAKSDEAWAWGRKYGDDNIHGGPS